MKWCCDDSVWPPIDDCCWTRIRIKCQENFHFIRKYHRQQHQQWLSDIDFQFRNVNPIPVSSSSSDKNVSSSLPWRINTSRPVIIKNNQNENFQKKGKWSDWSPIDRTSVWSGKDGSTYLAISVVDIE